MTSTLHGCMTRMMTIMKKMNNKAHDLSVYLFRKGEIFLIDTNVWLYLYPAPSSAKILFFDQYSKSLKAMLSAGARLVMDATVLSEYLNIYCRIEWNARHKSRYPRFKTFRNSADFAAVGRPAAIFARSMLKYCTRCDHPFSASDITRILTDFETGSNDFNDGLLVEICRYNNWKLVTNDSDFTSGGIEVLTANRKLLAACP